MKYAIRAMLETDKRRSPCGERGLKCHINLYLLIIACRSPCGERGLKYYAECHEDFDARRSPCGERGLKSGCV